MYVNKGMEETTMTEVTAFHVNKACEHLKQAEYSIQDYLAEYVASLCDVAKTDMFQQTDVVYLAHARWFYWYAYRYMTSESFDKIALQTFHGCHSFNSRTVQNGVSKMAVMIDSEPLWRKRWTIVKQLIKTYNEDEIEEYTITVNVPKKLKGIVKIKIKEI